jgi:purine-binding chemotaxis protein CheW
MTAEKVLVASRTESVAGMLLTFVVGKETYGIETENVDQIIGLQNITTMPQSRDDIRGLINLRGKLIPVLDLRLRFNTDPLDDERTGIVVVSHGGATMGLIVDKVLEVLSFSEISAVSLSVLNMDPANSCVDRFGVFKDQIIMILDCGCLMASDSM